MEKFFCYLFGKKKAPSEIPVFQIDLVADRKWEGRVCHLNHRNLRTLIPVIMDFQRPEYKEDIKNLVTAAKLTVAFGKSGKYWWDFKEMKAEVLEKNAWKDVMLRVTPSTKFVKPESADFFEELCIWSVPGKPVEVFCDFAIQTGSFTPPAVSIDHFDQST